MPFPDLVACNSSFLPVMGHYKERRKESESPVLSVWADPHVPHGQENVLYGQENEWTTQEIEGAYFLVHVAHGE